MFKWIDGTYGEVNYCPKCGKKVNFEMSEKRVMEGFTSWAESDLKREPLIMIKTEGLILLSKEMEKYEGKRVRITIEEMPEDSIPQMGSHDALPEGWVWTGFDCVWAGRSTLARKSQSRGNAGDHFNNVPGTRLNP